MKLWKSIIFLGLSFMAATLTAAINCKDDPMYIKISTVDELLMIGKDVNYPDSGRYCIVNDLNFDNVIREETLIKVFNGKLVGAYKDVKMKQPVILNNLNFIDKNIGLIHNLYGALENIHIRNATFAGSFVFPFAAIMESNSQIVNSSISNSKISSSTDVSGMVGTMKSNSAILYSYANIEVIEAMHVFGLVKNIDKIAIVSNSYATGTVENVYNFNGLADKNSGIIYKSYASFNYLSDVVESAGLVAYQDDYRYCHSSYWDRRNHSNVKDSLCINNGEELPSGRTSIQMRQQLTYINWDFKNVWRMGRNGYPDLRSNSRYN